jgi:hypothetical protein
MRKARYIRETSKTGIQLPLSFWQGKDPAKDTAWDKIITHKIVVLYQVVVCQAEPKQGSIEKHHRPRLSTGII